MGYGSRLWAVLEVLESVSGAGRRKWAPGWPLGCCGGVLGVCFWLWAPEMGSGLASGLLRGCTWSLFLAVGAGNGLRVGFWAVAGVYLESVSGCGRRKWAPGWLLGCCGGVLGVCFWLWAPEMGSGLASGLWRGCTWSLFLAVGARNRLRAGFHPVPCARRAARWRSWETWERTAAQRRSSIGSR